MSNHGRIYPTARAKWWVRGLVVFLMLVQVGFVVWESVDYRGPAELGNAVGMFVVSLFCALVTWWTSRMWGTC